MVEYVSRGVLYSRDILDEKKSKIKLDFDILMWYLVFSCDVIQVFDICEVGIVVTQ